MKRFEANVGQTPDGLVVESGTVVKGYYLRKILSVDVVGHYITRASYEIRQGEDGQLFDDMTYLARVNCSLAGY